jgi:hypothetical protein
MVSLSEKHSFISETKFRFKSLLLSIKRQFQNTLSPVQRFKDNGHLKNHGVISFSESALWNPNDNEQNWILTAGKIQNLRIAIQCINGIEIPANTVFSFWKHIGNPNIGKGYVIGREIREGCIVPTIAGGLCQLSNALYDAALKANFEIIERHQHTRVIKGSLAEQGRDATVKWNYVDLRFKSDKPFRIEIEITSDQLIVKFKSAETAVESGNSLINAVQSSKLNDCYSCGNFSCFKHPDRSSIKQENAITTFILDDKWDEYDDYIQSISTDKDLFLVPLRKNKWIKTNRYNWTVNAAKNLKSVPFAAFKRALKLRFANSKNNAFSLLLRYDKKVAEAMLKHIPIKSSHIVISQNLLPYAWEKGIFGGRTFDVLMSRLPMEKLHQTLDLAQQKYSESKTLNDFRAPQEIIDVENTALTKSRNIITPHQGIADIFTNKVIRLNWISPKKPEKKIALGNKILFPASAIGRKGAYEMKRLAKELNFIIVVSGKIKESESFWEELQVESSGTNPFENIGLLVYPAYVEHQPRLLLKALFAGIPVITTTAAGLAPRENLTIVPIGDYEALKREVVLQLKKLSA